MEGIIIKFGSYFQQTMLQGKGNVLNTQITTINKDIVILLRN